MMIFSTYYDIEGLNPYLPGVGDIITVNDPERRAPLTIQKIIRDGFRTVKFLTASGVLPSEVCEWWPDVGDIVTVNAGLYSTWRAQQKQKQRMEFLDDWHLYGRSRVQRIAHNQAVISPVDASQTWTPETLPVAFCHVLTVSGVRLRDMSKVKHLLAPEKEKPSKETLEISKAAQKALFEEFGIAL